MRSNVERAFEQPFERCRRQTLQMRERGAQLAERLQLRRVELGDRFEERGRRRVVGLAGRTREQHAPGRHGRRRVEIDELALAQQARERCCARLLAHVPRGSGGVLELHGVTQQHVQQRRGRRHRGRRSGLRRRQRRIGEQRGDVVRRERRHAVELAGLHERRGDGHLAVRVRRILQTRMPAEAERIQHGARHRILRREPAARVQVLADESAQMIDVARPEQITQPVRRRDRIALQYRREILRRIVAAADARHVGHARMPQPIRERLQRRREPAFARVRDLRGIAAERRHRQHAVGLTADAQRRQRTERTHVRDEMLARPRDRLEREAGAFEADQVHQIVAPRRRPQRGCHLSARRSAR